jgi:hypothetical protein
MAFVRARRVATLIAMVPSDNRVPIQAADTTLELSIIFGMRVEAATYPSRDTPRFKANAKDNCLYPSKRTERIGKT